MESPCRCVDPAAAGSHWRLSRRAHRIWVNSKATPQPAGTFTERVRVTGAYRAIPKKAFVQATGWDKPSTEVAKLREDPGWQVYEIACGHDIPVEEPDELAAVLEKCA